MTRLLQGLAVLLGFAYTGARSGAPIALLDNLSNFPVHFAAAFLACAAALLALKRRAWAFAAAAGAAIALAQVIPWYAGKDGATLAASRPAVKMLVSNVYFANRMHGRLKQLVAEENPDLVGLVEVNARWLGELGELRAAYPYHFEAPDERTVGLALYSRLPLSNARLLRAGDFGTPAIVATLAAPGGDVEFILAHPVPPIDAAHIRRRNAQLLALGRHVRELGRPAVIAGDLNVTMWNRGYRAFAAQGALRNARKGHGVGPTWPSIWPLGVPIDHVLASPGVELLDFRVLDGIGSDHLPIATEFSLR